MRGGETPIVNVGVDETKDCDEEHNGDVETGEDVVEPRGLLDAQAEDNGEEEGDAKGKEVWVGGDVLDVDRHGGTEGLLHRVVDQTVQVARVSSRNACCAFKMGLLTFALCSDKSVSCIMLSNSSISLLILKEGVFGHL